ncbi:uncharacterized protein LOC62_06G008052 [Vanrija pseudolonga]|uniref:N-acetyltransferase domain-containing protein n=1 Tax=Vanrija pseudolonga TaxID=143232 RepID=A0AAF0YIE9_9TREE|nr:hypothetical protein LOC62_06G008052 [Vanrija pseudolonga]
MTVPTPAVPLPPVAVQWDGAEPYLTPPTRPELRLTPYRDTAAEVAGLIALNNHPEVGKWSHGRPYPFTEDSARTRLDNNLSKQAAAVAELQENPEAKIATTLFSVIRSDESDYIGDLMARPVDEATGRWAAAYAVHPDFHSRGIGTAAVATVLAWAKSMGAKSFEITIETANPASSRLAQKLGFTRDKLELIDWPEHHGGGQREVATWHHPGHARLATMVSSALSTPGVGPPAPPVHWDDAADEPYLELSVPGYRVTSNRDTPTEEDDLIEISNLPEVSRYAFVRPFPYDRGHARAWIDKSQVTTHDAVAALKADPGAEVDTSPFCAIRDAAGRLVGDVGIWSDSNETRPYARSLGYTLHPKLHRQGIGFAAVGAVIAWARAKLQGVKVLDAGIEEDNTASQALATKLGFTKVLTKTVSWPEDKGGGTREVGRQECTNDVGRSILRAGGDEPLSNGYMTAGVQWDDTTGEPYLDLPGHPGVRITPYHDTPAEEDALIEISNLPEVGRWSYGRPYPDYTRADARERLDELVAPQAATAAALRENPAAVVTTCPFAVVRDDTGAYLGEVYVWPDNEREGFLELSYSLFPRVQGRGLGAAAVRRIVEWAGPALGAHTVEAMVETVNAPSNALMAKLGFYKAEVRAVRWPEEKGGEERECAFWRRDFPAPQMHASIGYYESARQSWQAARRATSAARMRTPAASVADPTTSGGRIPAEILAWGN